MPWWTGASVPYTTLLLTVKHSTTRWLFLPVTMAPCAGKADIDPPDGCVDSRIRHSKAATAFHLWRDGRVTFLARHRAKDGTYLGMRQITLDVHSFMRRFLLHTLPQRYIRIRHYGLTAPTNIKTLVPRARHLIKESAAVEVAADPVAEERDPPPDPSVCPKCGGRMLLLRAVRPQHTEYFDTS